MAKTERRRTTTPTKRLTGDIARAVRAALDKKALEVVDGPVYVRKEIIHNRYVVDELRNKGARFVEEVDEVPDRVVGVRESGVDELDVDELGPDEVDVVLLGAVVVVRGFGRVVVVGAAVVGEVVVDVVGDGFGTALG